MAKKRERGDKLQEVLWCVHAIVSNRRYGKSAKIHHIVGEMNAVIELQLILGERGKGVGKMNHKGEDCTYCNNSYDKCMCHEAFEILNDLYGWSCELLELRQKDIRRIANILEREKD